MNSKLFLFAGLLLVLLAVSIPVTEGRAPGSTRTPEEIAAHKHRVMKMIEVAEKEELIALEWLMEDMDDEQIEEWRKTDPEQAARFDKLNKKYS